jgi:hypothetical protein
VRGPARPGARGSRRRCAAALALALLAGLTVACPGGETPTLDALALEPALVDLGPRPIGTTARRAVLLRHRGTSPVRLTPARVEGEGAGRLELLGVPAVLGPGAEHELALVARVDRIGPAVGLLRIGASDGAEAVLRVRVVGVGSALAFEPDRLALGPIAVGATSSATVDLVNRSDATVEVRALAAEPGADPSISARLAGVTQLAAGARVGLVLHFAPTEDGLARARFVPVADGLGPDPPRLEVEGVVTAGGLALDPQAVRLEAGLGRRARASLVLRNRSGRPIDAEWRVFGPFELAPSSPRRLEAGEGLGLELGFAPTVAGRHLGELVATAAGLPTLRVPIEGLAAEPLDDAVVAEPAALDFGAVESGQAIDLGLRLQTSGRAVDVVGGWSDLPGLRVIAARPRLAARDLGWLRLQGVPPGLGPVEGRVVVELSDGRRIERSVRGALRPAPFGGLRLEPERLELGPVDPTVGATRGLRLTGVGSATVAIAAIRVEPPSAGLVFDGPNLPLRLGPGATAHGVVSWRGPPPPADLDVALVLTSTLGDRWSLPIRVRPAVPASVPRVRVMAQGPAGAELDLHVARDPAAAGDAPGDLSACAPLVDWGPPGPDAREPILAAAGPGLGGAEIVLVGPEPGSYAVRLRLPSESGLVRLQVFGDGRVEEVERRLPADRLWTVGRLRVAATGELDFERAAEPLVAPAAPSCY